MFELSLHKVTELVLLLLQLAKLLELLVDSSRTCSSSRPQLEQHAEEVSAELISSIVEHLLEILEELGIELE
ncbi:MAG: hypothetical protein AMK75_02685 [Planctomycetes bacterium SM23_65]|nr:MAG: hypothetical protein AMK75_02685 [Planctomycetes bacterium SM23_65]